MLNYEKTGIFIGINTYSNGIAPLEYAMGDASDLNAEFSSIGFKPRLLCDNRADQNNIVAKTKEVIQDLEAGDIFVFYFSGHGYFNRGELHLLGASAEASLLGSGYGMLPLSVISTLSAKPGVKRFFMLDCCQSALHAGSKAIALCEAPIKIPGNSGSIAPLILTSCSVGEKSYEDPASGHSLFAKAVLDTLKDPTLDSFASLGKMLGGKINSAAQHPCWYGNTDEWANIPVFGGNAEKKTQSVPADPVQPVNIPKLQPISTGIPVGIPAAQSVTDNAFSLDSAVKNSEFQDAINSLNTGILRLKEVQNSAVARQFESAQQAVANRAQAVFAAGDVPQAIKIIADNRQECTAAVKKFAAAQKYDQAALVAVFADQNDREVIKAMLLAAARIIRGCPEFHEGINFYYLVFKNRKLNQFIAQSINKLPLPDRFKCNIDMKKTVGSTPAKTFSMKLSFMFRILPWLIIPALPFFLFLEILDNVTPRTTPHGYAPELFGELFLRNLHFYRQK